MLSFELFLDDGVEKKIVVPNHRWFDLFVNHLVQSLNS
jgi:hypothetical protein